MHSTPAGESYASLTTSHLAALDSAHPILAVLQSLVTASVVLLSAFGVGRPILRWLKLGDNDPLAVGVWSLALGLLMAGLTLFLLGLLGWLRPGAVAAVSLVGSLSAAAELICVYLAWTGGYVVDVARVERADTRGPAPRTEARILLVLATVVLAATFLGALAPPTSLWALSHTLEIPKTALLDGSIRVGLSRSAPQLVHMGYLWALSLDGPVAANLLAWAIGVLLALATVLLARPLLGSDRALLAGAAALLCPGVQYQMSVPLEDLAAALFATLALCALLDLPRRPAASRLPIAAGLMLGGLIASTGMGGGLDPSRLARPMLTHLGPAIGIGMAGLLFAPRGSGLWWLAVAAAAWAALAAVAFDGAGSWSVMVPPAAILAVWTWHELERLPRWARRCAWSAWGAVALVAPLACCTAAIDKGAVALGWQSRHAFLMDRVPTYRAASIIGRIGRRGERVLCQDPRTFYFPCLAASEHCPPYAARPPVGAAGDGACIASARAAGCTYLLLAQRDPFASNAPGESGASASVVATPSTASSPAFGQVIPILEYRFADDNNRCIRYRLLRLR